MDQLQELERLFAQFQLDAELCEAQLHEAELSPLHHHHAHGAEECFDVVRAEAEAEELRERLQVQTMANSKLQAELQQALARVAAREERMQEQADELKKAIRERDIAVNEKAKMANRNADLQTMYAQDTMALHDELTRLEKDLVQTKLGFAQASCENDELRKHRVELELRLADVKFHLATMKQLSEDRSQEVEALAKENCVLKEELQRLRDGIDRSPRSSMAEEPTTLSWSTFFAISPQKSSPSHR